MEYRGFPKHVRNLHAAPGPMSHDIEHWAQTFDSMGLAGVKLVDDGGSCFSFALEMRKRGMAVVTRLWRDRPCPGVLPPKSLSVAQRYIDEDMPVIEVTNENNLKGEWQEGMWPDNIRENAEISMTSWVADASAIINMGGFPAFPAQAQCGHTPKHSSIEWYEAAFKYLAENYYNITKRLFANGAWIASHDAVLNHVYEEEGRYRFDYPYDPSCQSRHPGKHIFQDDNSLIGHQVPVRLLWDYFKLVVPVMSTEGGIFFKNKAGWTGQWDTNYPSIDEWTHAVWNVKMFEWLAAYAARYPWYKGMFPWLACDVLCGCPASAWSDESWFQPGKTLQVVDELKKYPQIASEDSPILLQAQGGAVIHLSGFLPGYGSDGTEPDEEPETEPEIEPEIDPEVEPDPVIGVNRHGYRADGYR
ncbi:hypothetical protein KKH23_06235, partial [Patescibacteria group bacterium]|nr:hypothetical protein [Patescibacteria group bacterium]